jgi:hypothetical protein
VRLHVEIRVVDPARQIFDRVEDYGPASVLEQCRRRRRMLDDGAARSQVAAEDRHPTARLDRMGSLPDHLLARNVLRRIGDRAYGAACNGHCVEGEIRPELLQEARHAACPMEMLHVVRPRRLEVDQDRDLPPDPIELLKVDPHAAPAGDRRQVHESIR